MGLEDLEELVDKLEENLADQPARHLDHMVLLQVHKDLLVEMLLVLMVTQPLFSMVHQDHLALVADLEAAVKFLDPLHLQEVLFPHIGEAEPLYPSSSSDGDCYSTLECRNRYYLNNSSFVGQVNPLLLFVFGQNSNIYLLIYLFINYLEIKISKNK